MMAAESVDLHARRARELDTLSVYGVLLGLFKGWGVIARTTVIVGSLGVIFAVLRPARYTTEFSFIPQVQQDGGRAALAGLAGQLGLSIGGAGSVESPQLYADILRSRDLLLPVMSREYVVAERDSTSTSLASLLNTEERTQGRTEASTLRILRRRVIGAQAAVRTTGVVTVKVTTPFADLSLALSHELLRQIQDFNVTRRQSQALEERKFLDARVGEARDSLRKGEIALMSFLEANRRFRESATLVAAYERIEREVVFRQQVVTALSQQLEEARLREVRDTPVLTLVQSPARPALPDARFRVLIVLVSLVLGALLGVALVITRLTVRLGSETVRADYRELVAEVKGAFARAQTAERKE